MSTEKRKTIMAMKEVMVVDMGTKRRKRRRRKEDMEGMEAVVVGVDTRKCR
jgi:hypothetical protein